MQPVIEIQKELIEIFKWSMLLPFFWCDKAIEAGVVFIDSAGVEINDSFFYWLQFSEKPSLLSLEVHHVD